MGIEKNRKGRSKIIEEIKKALYNWIIHHPQFLQSPLLNDHAQTIGIDPSLSNNAIYEHKCLENNIKLYKQSGTCDDQQQFKDILEADMISTP